MEPKFINNELQPVKITLDHKDIFVEGELTYNGDGTFNYSNKSTQMVNVSIPSLRTYVNIDVLYPLTQIIFKRTALEPKELKKEIHILLKKYYFVEKDKYMRLNYSYPKWDNLSHQNCIDVRFDDSTSMLHIEELNNRWITVYQGFCKSMEEFMDILKWSYMSHIIMTQEEKIEHFKQIVIQKHPNAKFIKSHKYKFSTILSEPFKEDEINAILEEHKNMHLWDSRFLSPVTSLSDYKPLVDVVVHDEVTAWWMASGR